VGVNDCVARPAWPWFEETAAPRPTRSARLDYETVENYEPDYRYFKVRDTKGELFILRNDVASDRWELTSSHRNVLG